MHDSLPGVEFLLLPKTYFQIKLCRFPSPLRLCTTACTIAWSASLRLLQNTYFSINLWRSPKAPHTSMNSFAVAIPRFQTTLLSPTCLLHFPPPVRIAYPTLPSSHVPRPSPTLRHTTRLYPTPPCADMHGSVAEAHCAFPSPPHHAMVRSFSPHSAWCCSLFVRSPPHLQAAVAT